MPNTISVSPAQPNKLVVNGCDLMNRAELSSSQNRELQRYIDANAHLLGLLDKPKDENEEPVDQSKYNSLGRYSTTSAPVHGYGSIGGDDFDRNRASQSLNRVHSPASSDYARRKGVSWIDNLNANKDRGRSHSPSQEQKNFSKSVAPNYHASNNDIGSNNYRNNSNNNNGGGGGDINGAPGNQNSQSFSNAARPYSPAYSTSDKRRTPYDYDPYGIHRGQQASLGRRTESPWGNSSIISRESRSRDQRGGRDGSESWKGFPLPDTPLYSSLERHPDDYNRFETHRYRELQSRRSQDRDDTIKFYGYGDHKVSGLELKPKRWTGGEIVTDPSVIKKSLKPRRIYYSPIGDGVVNADGVELKRLPKDMTPYVSVRHERYLEKGSGGHAGHKVREEVWSEGGGRGDDGNQNAGAGRGPPYDGNKDLGAGRGPPFNNGDGGKWPDNSGGPNGLDNGCGPRRGPATKSKSPFGDDDSSGNKFPKASSGFPLDDDFGPRSASALSVGTDGYPREGWTKTFIVNPRELINQYGNETQTIIFDIDDHTPKTTTTIKETISQSPARN